MDTKAFAIPDRFLTPRQVAAETGASLVQIYRLLANGKLKARKTYGLWRIPASAVEELKRTHPLLGRRTIAG